MDIVENGERMLLEPPLDRKSVRMVLDSGSYILYRVAEDHDFIRQYEDTLYVLTEIKHAARKIIILAAESILCPFILHTCTQASMHSATSRNATLSISLEGKTLTPSACWKGPWHP
jgi:hypothetical protein